jgi:acyl-homoserine lactone acylase PvdQ
VEFGPKIKAKSLLAGGESGHQGNPHFFDQASMYTEGKFKPVFFDRSEVMKQATLKYHP